MIDFIKINNLLIGSKIQNLLDFEIKVNQQTGEELTARKKSAYLKNLVFTITPGERYAKVQGSIHKYSNNGERNNDRFTFDKFLMVADELKEYISPDDNINILEFGVNIHTPFDPSDFINNIISHLNKRLNRTNNSGIDYSQVEYSNFVLKIYNKGLQQGPKGSNILRIEVKYLKMQRLFPDGLKWAHLSKIETWEYLGEVLQKKFNEVICFDPSINLKQVPERDMEIINRGHNPIYWESLSGPHVSRSRKQYQNLISKYGNMFNVLPELLRQEINKVVKCSHFSTPEKLRIIRTHFTELVNCSPLLYGNNSPCTLSASSGKVFCKVSGLDISCQKKGSEFLCISGIRKLYKEDPIQYKKLKIERLSERWQNEPLETQFSEICHSIRNEYFNPKHNSRNAILKQLRDPALFDIMPFIRHEKMVEAGLYK